MFESKSCSELAEYYFMLLTENRQIQGYNLKHKLQKEQSVLAAVFTCHL